ncbi:MAG: acetylornithine deacetylase [Chloroflexota bacterium]|nr:acetylornithine deacetylase [Chloroflexota bacterium]
MDFSGIDAKVDEGRIIDFFKSVVRIPSERYQEHNVARHVGAYMDGIGMRVTYHPFTQGGAGMVNVVGRYGSNAGGKRVVMCAHMDTGSGQYDGLVFQPDKWTKDPLDPVVERGYFYGLGAFNDKQGICCAVSAADAIIKSGVPIDGEIICAFVCAETVSGVGAGHLFEKGIDADLGVILESTGMEIQPIAWGSVRARIIVKGEHKHHEPHANPVETLRYVLDAFSPGYGANRAKSYLTTKVREPELPDMPYIAIRAIHSDPADLDRVNAAVDVMTMHDQTPQSVGADLARLIADLKAEHEDFDAEVEVEGWDPPRSANLMWGAGPNTPVDSELVRTIAKHHEVVRGTKPYVGAGTRTGAGSDAASLRRAGIQTVEYAPGSIGPDGDFAQWPTTDERIKVKDVVDCSRVLARAVAELCNQPRGRG